MKIKLYQIDAFANRVFTGNPAAVCILDEWLDDAMMQNIAAENNLAETAFAVKKGTQYELRWFTPTVEVDLCGHATLATAFVLFTYYQHPANRITFHSPRSGKLTVDKSATDLILDFPTDELHQIEAPKILLEAFDCPPQVVLKGKTDFLLIFQNQQEIERLNPDLQKLVKAGDRGVIVSAQGDEVDFVSRFFAPQSGIAEDPVTGSAHTSLAPYWAKVLGKNSLQARQLSKRGGQLSCEYLGERVKIAGQAVTYLVGEIDI